MTVLDNLSRIETPETVDESRNTAAYDWDYLDQEHPDVELLEEDISDDELLEEETSKRTDITFDDWREGDQKV